MISPRNDKNKPQAAGLIKTCSDKNLQHLKHQKTTQKSHNHHCGRNNFLLETR